MTRQAVRTPTVEGMDTTPGQRSRIPRWLAANWIDVGTVSLATILFVSGWPTLFETHSRMTPVAAPIAAAAMTLPVVMARVQPLLGWTIVMVAAVVIPVVWGPPTAVYGYPWHPGHLIAIQVLLFAVAVRMPPGVTLIAGAITSGAALVYLPGEDGRGWTVGFAAIAVGGYLVQRLVVSRRQLARQEAETEEERAVRILLEEKAAIARDLHDIVAHHMSMVVVAAQTAPYRHAEVSEPIRAEFDTIAQTARNALDEVRGILGVLRTDQFTAPLAPQPGLDQLPALFDTARRAGVQLSVDVVGEPMAMEESVQLCAYRCVQEALANAGRHAPGAPVSVRITYGRTELTVSVRNPITDSAPGEGNGGNGLRGMRDRAEALGGLLFAAAVDQTDGPSFEVRVHLPVVVREPAAQ